MQFPQDIQVFYVAPPALDEIKRHLREQDAAARPAADGDDSKTAEADSSKTAEDDSPAAAAEKDGDKTT